MIPILLLMGLTILIAPPFEWINRDGKPGEPTPSRRQIFVRHRLNLISRPLFLLILLIALRPVSDGFIPVPASIPPMLGHLLIALAWGALGLPIEAHYLAKRGITLRQLFSKDSSEPTK